MVTSTVFIMTWRYLMIFLLSSSLISAQEGSGWEGSGKVSEINEEIMIKRTERAYLLHHFQEWKSNKPELSWNPINIRGNSTQILKDMLKIMYQEFSSEFRMCYKCVGIITKSGHEYGCTEDVDTYDFDEPGKNKIIVPCKGPCMVSRRITDGDVTIVRSCHSTQCIGSEDCFQENGACIKCCHKNFCNRDLPTTFRIQKSGNIENYTPTVHTGFSISLSILYGTFTILWAFVIN
ncbi:uncharacterized protein LOC120342738 [Styela clava]